MTLFDRSHPVIYLLSITRGNTLSTHLYFNLLILGYLIVLLFQFYFLYFSVTVLRYNDIVAENRHFYASAHHIWWRHYVFWFPVRACVVRIWVCRASVSLWTRYFMLGAYFTNVNCVSKNGTGIAHYNFDADQPIFIIFGRNVAERICHQTVICYHTSFNYCLCTTWGNNNPRNCVFSVMLYTVSRKRNG